MDYTTDLFSTLSVSNATSEEDKGLVPPPLPSSTTAITTCDDFDDFAPPPPSTSETIESHSSFDLDLSVSNVDGGYGASGYSYGGLVSNNSQSNGPPGTIIRAPKIELTPQEEELVEFSEKIVDLVFVVDNTGSMSSEIEVAKNTVQTIISSLHEHFQTDLRFASISYRDHEDDYAVKEQPFTREVSVAKTYISEMSAQGGGDYPEALVSALKVLSEMPFNKKGKKIVIWIADAPPHGMGADGDSYPQGCKDENDKVIDWIKLGDYLMEKGVVFYSLVCERAKDDKQLTLFLDYLATKTHGKCLLLTHANKVPNLIINGCIEDDEMDTLIAQKIQELGESRVKEMKEEELVLEIQKLTENSKVKQVQTYEVVSSNTKKLMECESLSSVSSNWYMDGLNTTNMCGASSDADFAYGEVANEAPKYNQVFKACMRNFKKK